MYRDDLAAERARSKTLEAELKAEAARRRAAEAMANAASARCDEVRQRAGLPPKPPRGALRWLLAGAAAMSLACGCWLVGLRVQRAEQRVSVLQTTQHRLRQELATLRRQNVSSPRQKTTSSTCSLGQRHSRRRDSLRRAEIQHGMRQIKHAVQDCYHRYKVPGLANVQLRIDRDGTVGRARTKGSFAGKPTGACVAAAVKRARFPRFTGPPIKITYPFVLR